MAWRRSTTAWRFRRRLCLPANRAVIMHDICELKDFIAWGRRSGNRWRRCCATFARIRVLGNDPSNGSKDLFHCWFLLCRGRSHRINDL
jgi:hypothetical protein